MFEFLGYLPKRAPAINCGKLASKQFNSFIDVWSGAQESD
jgi:hypothetical protein